MLGIIGKKIGMTSIFDEDGKSIPCTVIQAEPNVITQIRTEETDGYKAVQIAAGNRKEKNTPASLMGHFAKVKSAPKAVLTEIRDYEGDLEAGATIDVSIFEEGEFVDIVGQSKGKGFQGVVKRHGFGGVGGRTHGQHNRERAPGSIGAASYPARVFKGMRMAGRTGNDRVKMTNLQVLKVLKDENVLVVKGSIPGHKGSYVFIEK